MANFLNGLTWLHWVVQLPDPTRLGTTEYAVSQRWLSVD